MPGSGTVFSPGEEPHQEAPQSLRTAPTTTTTEVIAKRRASTLPACEDAPRAQADRESRCGKGKCGPVEDFAREALVDVLGSCDEFAEAACRGIGCSSGGLGGLLS
jgi:hypothetical protein